MNLTTNKTLLRNEVRAVLIMTSGMQELPQNYLKFKIFSVVKVTQNFGRQKRLCKF